MARTPARKPARKKARPSAARPRKLKLTQVERAIPEPPPAPRALPSGDPDSGAFPIEIDPQRIDEALTKLRDEVSHWAKKGRYTRVRFKFRGKQLLPDLPLAAVAAVEGLTFYWGGILRALIFNLAGKTVFDVELVNDSEKFIARGKEALLSGELDKALIAFRDAIDIQRDNASAHLNLGVALKLKGDVNGARAALQRAQALGGDGPVSKEAERMLSTLPPASVSPPAA